MELIANIDVDDLEKAIAFYRDALGLRLNRLLFDGDVAEMIGASAKIYLLAKPAGSFASAGGARRRDYDRHWTPVHLDFAVADVDAAVARAARHGASIEQPLETHAWGRIASLADPFGHGFCLLEFSGEGYDAAAVQDRRKS